MIRKIVIATGVVTSIAGSASNRGGCSDGTGPRASFDWPMGIVADGKGNLFVSDCQAIRRVSAATGIVVTIAGLLEVAGSYDSHSGTAP
jgi:hypothetical protein